jgi:cytochrome d ubiquinol oxidase subunit I
MQTQTTDYALEVPHLGSLILTHDWNGEVKGLDDFNPEDRPFSPLVFWAFRVMVGLGLVMALLGFAGLALRRGGALYHNAPLLRAMVVMAPSGFIALLAGWVVTEVGRQPFTVYGMLRTAQSVSPIATPGVAVSLAAFAVVYFTVFGAGLVFLLRMMARSPVAGEPGPTPDEPSRTAGITPGPAAQIASPAATFVAGE